ncbi:MAG: hypothetical protein JWO56_2384 [Acidobacteria bacterium]|nr:hypothetical protein [Acidobacteriota bacterium]
MIAAVSTRNRRFAALYATWTLLCALGFFALRGAEDPSRRAGRILSDDAATRAVTILRQTDPVRFATYEAVHVAYAGKGEGGPAARWIVLCDRVPHTALTAAVVVELEAKSGALLKVREPE